MVDWIWRLCNISFESGVVPEDWRSAVIVSLYKVKKRERIRAIQMENLKRIRGLCIVTKGIDEKIDEGMLQWKELRRIGLPRVC